MNKLIIIIVVISIACDINSGEEIYHPRRHYKRNTDIRQPHQYLNVEKKFDCPKCQQNKQIERITETELTDLRIQFVKNQILKKLRLTEKPQVIQRDIPKPVVDGATIIEPNHDDNTINRMFDDYYGTTTQKIIFLKEGKFNSIYIYHFNPKPILKNFLLLCLRIRFFYSIFVPDSIQRASHIRPTID